MAGVVALFGAEGGAEGIDLAQRHGQGFGFQLAGNGQVDRALEEILREINGAVLCLGDVVQVHRRDLEHLARAFAVRAREDRGVDVGEAVFVEELVQRERGLPAHAVRGQEGVGARTQVGHRAQVLGAHLLFLQRVFRAAGAEDLDGIGVDLKRLLGLRGQHQAAGDGEARVQAALGDFGIIFELVGLKHDLHGFCSSCRPTAR